MDKIQFKKLIRQQDQDRINKIKNSLPIGLDLLEELIVYLENNIKSCNNDLTLTHIFFDNHNINLNSEIIKRFNDNGGYCDCEIINNIGSLLGDLVDKRERFVTKNKKPIKEIKQSKYINIEKITSPRKITNNLPLRRIVEGDKKPNYIIKLGKNGCFLEYIEGDPKFVEMAALDQEKVRKDLRIKSTDLYPKKKY